MTGNGRKTNGTRTRNRRRHRCLTQSKTGCTIFCNKTKITRVSVMHRMVRRSIASVKRFFSIDYMGKLFGNNICRSFSPLSLFIHSFSLFSLDYSWSYIHVLSNTRTNKENWKSSSSIVVLCVLVECICNLFHVSLKMSTSLVTTKKIFYYLWNYYRCKSRIEHKRSSIKYRRCNSY